MKIPGWLPWLLGGGLLVALAVTARGCAAEKTERARYAADMERMKTAVEGAKSNETVALAALKNKDKRIADLESSAKRSACEGVWVERFGPDGHLSERRCEGKSTAEEVSSRTKTGEESTPEIAQPFKAPERLEPSVKPAAGGAVTRWAVSGGVGISLDPLVLPVYYAGMERRLFGPFGVGAWAHWPAPAAGVAIAVRW